MSSKRERKEIYCTPRWLELRNRARIRDGFLCVACKRSGLTSPGEIVHHSVPIREGGDPWDIDNLETLCRDCHDAAHERPDEVRDGWSDLVAETLKEYQNEKIG